MREFFNLAPELTFLNHGSFGATPKPVFQAQDACRRDLERNPVAYFVDVFPQALRAAADRLANFVGAKGDQLVFVDNATTGVNTVLRSLTWHAGDEILMTSHGYAAVHKAVRALAETTGIKPVVADFPYPPASAAQVVESVSDAITPATRLVILDHITSPTAIVLPVAEIAALCRARDIPIFIDGAHAPGMIPLNLNDLGADFYTGNAHKWLCAAKGCAFLHVARRHLETIRPLVQSHGYREGFLQEFDWPGTKDPSPWLTVTTAMDFLESLDWDRIHAWQRQLIRDAADVLGVRDVLDSVQAEMRCAMLTFPIHCQGEPSEQLGRDLRSQLLREHRIEVPIMFFQEKLWCRISAQIYNELADYQRLRDALSAMGLR